MAIQLCLREILWPVLHLLAKAQQRNKSRFFIPGSIPPFLDPNGSIHMDEANDSPMIGASAEVLALLVRFQAVQL